MLSPNNGKSNGKESGKGLCRGTHWDNIRVRMGFGFRVEGTGFRE